MVRTLLPGSIESLGGVARSIDSHDHQHVSGIGGEQPAREQWKQRCTQPLGIERHNRWLAVARPARASAGRHRTDRASFAAADSNASGPAAAGSCGTDRATLVRRRFGSRHRTAWKSPPGIRRRGRKDGARESKNSELGGGRWQILPGSRASTLSDGTARRFPIRTLISRNLFIHSPLLPCTGSLSSPSPFWPASRTA